MIVNNSLKNISSHGKASKILGKVRTVVIVGFLATLAFFTIRFIISEIKISPFFLYFSFGDKKSIIREMKKRTKILEKEVNDLDNFYNSMLST